MNESQIKQALYDWLSVAMGLPTILVIDFDINFVTGNLIDADVNGNPITQVAFDTDQATTLQALCDELYKAAEILKAVVTGAKQITVYGAINGVDLVIDNLVATGGLTQPAGTITESQAASKVTVIHAEEFDRITNTGDPRPDYPFATIRLDSLIKIGQEEVLPVDPVTQVSVISGQRQMTVNIHYYGPKAFEEISKAYISLGKPSVWTRLYAAGIAFLEKLPIQNLTGLLETKYEEHTSFDFYIGFAENVEDDLGYVSSVVVQGENDGQTLPDLIIGP